MPPELSGNLALRTLQQTAAKVTKTAAATLIWASVVWLLAAWSLPFARLLFWAGAAVVLPHALHTLVVGVALPLFLVPHAALTRSRAIVRPGEGRFLLLAALLRAAQAGVQGVCLYLLHGRL